MPGCSQCTEDAVACVDLGLDRELVPKPAKRVERTEWASRGCVEPDKECELRVGDGLAVGANEVRELISGGGEARGGEERSESVERREAVPKTLLAAGPVEEGECERGRWGRVRAEDQIGRAHV